jgi:hypothetical protein
MLLLRLHHCPSGLASIGSFRPACPMTCILVDPDDTCKAQHTTLPAATPTSRHSACQSRHWTTPSRNLFKDSNWHRGHVLTAFIRTATHSPTRHSKIARCATSSGPTTHPLHQCPAAQASIHIPPLGFQTVAPDQTRAAERRGARREPEPGCRPHPPQRAHPTVARHPGPPPPPGSQPAPPGQRRSPQAAAPPRRAAPNHSMRAPWCQGRRSSRCLPQ